MLMLQLVTGLLGDAAPNAFVISQEKLIFTFGGLILALLAWCYAELKVVNAKVNTIDKKLAVLSAIIREHFKQNGDSET